MMFDTLSFLGGFVVCMALCCTGLLAWRRYDQSNTISQWTARYNLAREGAELWKRDLLSERERNKKYEAMLRSASDYLHSLPPRVGVSDAYSVLARIESFLHPAELKGNGGEPLDDQLRKHFRETREARQ